MVRLSSDFFRRDCPEVARDLVGKVLVYKGNTLRISETECYCGENDTACHASRGRTKRTEVMYGKAGTVYVYLCYGMHWMLNIITGEKDDPGFVMTDQVEEGTVGRKLRRSGFRNDGCDGRGGGGRPDFATAGAKNADKIDEALAAVIGLVEGMVK